jgi:dipeptidyl aminopeptidase/acylaminoacyl peptidase
MSGKIAAWTVRAVACAGLLGLLLHVPCGVAATIRQLVEVVDIKNVSVSPDGRQVAFRTEQASIERNTYETVWYVQPVDGTSPPRRLGGGGEMLPDGGGSSKPELPAWSPDGKWIFFRAVHDARIEVWRAAVNGSRTEQLTHETANVRSFSLNPDGSVLYYSVGATRQAVIDAELVEYDQGVRIDRTVMLGEPLFRSGFQDGRLATQRLRGGLRLQLLSDAPDHWKALELSTGVTTELASGRHPGSPVTAADLPPGGGEIVRVAEDRGSKRIAVLREQSDPQGRAGQSSIVLSMLPSMKSGRSVECTAGPCTGKQITDIVWRPASDEILFTVSERDSELQQSIFRWNVVSGDVHPVVRSRGQVTGGGRWGPEPCAASASAMVCVAAEAGVPPRLERIDLEMGSRSVLFAPNQALAQDMKASVRVRFVTWTDAQGRRYAGQFYPSTAKNGKPPPLFVVYYRCTGFLRGSVGDEWPLATFAGKGIAALCINAAPLTDDAVARYQQGLSAVEGAVTLLAKQGVIDPTRVGMGGLSFGSEVTVWTAMHSDLLRAISVSSPVVTPMGSLMMSLGGKEEHSRMGRYWQLGTLEETPDRWRQLSPTYHIERMRAPVLMQMPEQEFRYSLDFMVPLIRRHRADVYVFPYEQHQKSQPRHKLVVYERNLDWFRFWLQKYEDPSPDKAGQYRIWREMRDVMSARPTQSDAHSGG